MKSLVARKVPLFLFALLIAGCAPKTDSQASLTPLPPVLPTVTFTATATSTPAATPTSTLQPTPTDQVGCADSAKFVADLTIPDDTVLGAGAPFVKSWRLQNTGTCIWNMRYKLVFLRGEQMGASSAGVPFPETEPGQTADLSIDLIAPVTGGTFTGTFQFENPSGQRFGLKDGNIWVRIVVSGGAVAATPVTGSTPATGATAGACSFTLNADYISQVLALINDARVSNGLSALAPNAALSASAQAHSQDMACNNFIKHIGSDGSSEAQRIAAQGYVSGRDDEVIYAGFPSGTGNPVSVVNWWLTDATHRPVLLAPDFTEFGVGYAFVSTSGAGGYFTVDFAKPK